VNDARLELGRCSGLAERIDVARHEVGEDDLDELGVRDARDQLDPAITRFCIPDDCATADRVREVDSLQQVPPKSRTPIEPRTVMERECAQTHASRGFVTTESDTSEGEHMAIDIAGEWIFDGHPFDAPYAGQIGLTLRQSGTSWVKNPSASGRELPGLECH
jgi:hypothetical protein